MPKPVSAGVLLYRKGPDDIEVLLVHPSGSYNRRAPWGIPKGLPDAGEDLEHAARRETLEETGVAVTGSLRPLGSIDYKKSRKTVVAFGGPASENDAPKCASWEVDQAEFVPLARAREIIHPDQQPFLDRLLEEILKAPR